MNETYIRNILNKIKEGIITADEAFEQLKDLPYRDMGFANVDNHRQIRTGFPEVVYCEGKKSEQIRDIFAALAEHGVVMGTRATECDYETVKTILPDVKYYKIAKIICCKNDKTDVTNKEKKIGKVAVVSAGTADMPIAEEASVTAEILGNEVSRIYDVGVAGIHRLLAKIDIIREADVVIVVAGMEGALASVLGGLVSVPVIAVPTSIGYGSNFGGLSALLSMLNSCANGVAVVNIDNGFGAAYMASVINKQVADKVAHMV